MTSRNVEVKARLMDKQKVLEALGNLSRSKGEILRQRDTFLNVPNGRLKHRRIEGVGSELIYYDRPDAEGPKLSVYEKFDCPENSNLLSVLVKALGVKGQVNKVRHLFMLGQSRIHIDEVEDLGSFFEIEVVLNADQTVEEGQEIAEDIMSVLGIDKDSLLSGAYMDLLLQK